MTEILALANYDVFVGNCTESLSVFMSRYSQRKVVVLTDEHTHTFCLERIRPLLPLEILEISIPAGEVHKDLNTCKYPFAKNVSACLLSTTAVCRFESSGSV